MINKYLLIIFLLAFFTSCVPNNNTGGGSSDSTLNPKVNSKTSTLIIREDSDLTISQGKSYIIDESFSTGYLFLDGNLECGRVDLELKVKGILISETGSFKCGDESNPHMNNLKITLRGGELNDNALYGTHFLVNLGELSVSGYEKTNHTRLSRTAYSGTDIIQVAESNGWEIGDVLVISSTRPTNTESELVKISEINESSVRIDRNLLYKHYGGSRKTLTSEDGNNSWQFNESAVVINTSRNIKIVSEDGVDFVGGHTMSSKSGSTRLFSVELENMGQAMLQGGSINPILGRYPIHYHELGDTKSQIVRGLSLKNTNNRCVSIHNTNSVIVDNNVCYRHVGHGFFLEDGTESLNTISNNVSMKAMKVSGLPILETDNRDSLISKGATGFWISNTNNIVTDNIATDSAASGFWYSIDSEVNSRAFGEFDNNISISNPMAMTTCVDSSGGKGIPLTSNLMVYSNFHSINSGFNFRNSLGYMEDSNSIWNCGFNQEYKGLVMYNSGGDVSVGESSNAVNAAFISASQAIISNSLFLVDDSLYDRIAISFYDSGLLIKDSSFLGYIGKNAFASSISAATKVSNNRVFNVEFSTGTNFVRTLTDESGFVNAHLHPSGASLSGLVIHDLDGSISSNLGLQGTGSIVSNNPIMTYNNCQFFSQTSYCQYRFNTVRILLEGKSNSLSNPVYRVSSQDFIMSQIPQRTWYQNNSPVNTMEFVTYSSSDIDSVISSGKTISVLKDFGLDGDYSIMAIKVPQDSIVLGMQAYQSKPELFTENSSEGYFYTDGVIYIKSILSGSNWQSSKKLIIRKK